ncbi:MAG: glycine betaine ABC transporter substrate-binding protein [Bacillota bacterium]|nr:glycine betaine ABC transporter substrate-binding protein [Bacillota bacterium]
MKKHFTLIMLVILLCLAFVVIGCGSEGSYRGPEMRLATSAEWTERADGLSNFEEHYGFEYPRSQLVIVELGLSYQAVGSGQAEIGVGDATEGRIAQYNLVVLEDDLLFFPAYNPAPVIRGDVLERYPEIADIMMEVSQLLDLETLTLLNKNVTVENNQPEDVARTFLIEQGLISSGEPEADPAKDTPVIVSGKTFAEALTLGYMTAYLLEDRGFTVIDEVGLAEVALIRPALEAGEIDIYWEYTGTGLINVMGHDEVVTDPQLCYELIRDWDLDNNDIIWLDYAPANNTFVLFISPEVYEEYGWTKLSDLAEFFRQNK